MIPKPKHLSGEYAAWFKDQSIIEAYPNRPAYPSEVFEVLCSLIGDLPHTVLDVGCGTGDIARRLVRMVDRVDAVDFSSGMIEKGRHLPDGDHPNLRWIYGPVEEVPLTPPYALITAGESLHWLAWEVVFPRFVHVLAPKGFVAIIERDWDTCREIRDRLRSIFHRYGLNRDWRPYDLVNELQIRGLLDKQGEHWTKAVAWHPTVEEYIECRHSQNGFSRQRMGQGALAFDRELREALEDLQRTGALSIQNGKLQLEVEAKVTWGKPLWRLGEAVQG